MKTVDKITFFAHLVLERSITPKPEQLGGHECTMELFEYENGMYEIEWDVPALEMTEHIGIWIKEGTKIITDYDGVFDLPQEAVDLLKKNGFDTSEVES